MYRGDLATLRTSGYSHNTALVCAEPTTQLIVPVNDPNLGTADYFIVVATVGSEEGSYGRNSVGIERPASGAVRKPSQNLTSCVP